MMRNETVGVFVKENQTSELVRLTRFAASIQLCVRFKDAEKFVFVGNRFAFQHAAAGGAANLLCAT